jgi:hypothetical protein
MHNVHFHRPQIAGLDQAEVRVTFDTKLLDFALRIPLRDSTRGGLERSMHSATLRLGGSARAAYPGKVPKSKCRWALCAVHVKSPRDDVKTSGVQTDLTGLAKLLGSKRNPSCLPISSVPA